MHPRPRPKLHPLQLLHRPQHSSPHRIPVQVALIEQSPSDVGAQKKRCPVCWTGAWVRTSFASHPCWCLVRQGRHRHLSEGDNASYRATLKRTPSSCPAGSPGSSSPHGQCYRRQSRSTSPPRLAVGSAYCASSHTADLPEHQFASPCWFPRPAGFAFLRRSYKGFRGRKRGEHLPAWRPRSSRRGRGASRGCWR